MPEISPETGVPMSSFTLDETIARNETAAAKAALELRRQEAARKLLKDMAFQEHDWNPMTLACNRCGLARRDFENAPWGLRCPPNVEEVNHADLP